ncbi:ATP-binding protein, partial [Streptomyces sp. NPDC127574]|uniref:ATP-binding protein n=1 Tax=Streptomyces sp. NPDC127574 TaxID=3345401 RepID=UPI00362BFC04
ICRCTVTSSALVGSSAMISCGSAAIAIAMRTRCRIRLGLDEGAGLVRIEVCDAAAAKRPPAAPPPTCPEGESGRGLLLVDVLAARWGWTPRRPVGKTVWAEVPTEPAT